MSVPVFMKYRFCNQVQNIKHLHSGSVVESPLCDREVVGSILGGVIPKTLKMILLLFHLALSIKKVELELVSSVSV